MCEFSLVSRSSCRDRPWADRVEVVSGDVSDPADVAEALSDVEVAYYLVHSLTSGSSFAAEDRAMARVFATAAGRAGVRRIVYLGGLVPPEVLSDQLSDHLRSRAEVGEILRGSGVPTVELRAAVIIGSGSASFEMLRYLTERLPGDDHSTVGQHAASNRSPCVTSCGIWSARRTCHPR